MTLLLALVVPLIVVVDDFDRLEGRTLDAIPRAGDAEARDRLTLDELAALPNVLDGVRSPVLVVRTDRGNPCRLIVAPGFWAPPPAEGDDPAEPVPVLILERFATFEGAGGSAPDRLAAGQNVLLFTGFQIDLDSGQIVPEGRGGDLAFIDPEDDGPRLEAVGGASLFPLTEAPEFAEPPPDAPSAGRAIVPGDYAGRFALRADGSLTGTLDLTIDDRTVSGRFRSDETGASYEVSGEVEPGTDPAIRFAIQFPRSRQEYLGRLFSEGKGAMAGSVTLIDRERPFYAVRDGAPSPDDPDPEDES